MLGTNGAEGAQYCIPGDEHRANEGADLRPVLRVAAQLETSLTEARFDCN